MRWLYFPFAGASPSATSWWGWTKWTKLSVPEIYFLQVFFYFQWGESVSCVFYTQGIKSLFYALRSAEYLNGTFTQVQVKVQGSLRFKWNTKQDVKIHWLNIPAFHPTLSSLYSVSMPRQSASFASATRRFGFSAPQQPVHSATVLLLPGFSDLS